MAKRIWRWIKKAFIVNLLTAVITFVVLFFLGVTSIVNLINWSKANPLLFIAGYALINLIIEGYFIEAVHKWKWTNR